MNHVQTPLLRIVVFLLTSFGACVHAAEPARKPNIEYDTWRVVPGQGSYEDPKFVTAAGKETIPGYATDVITDLSLAWLEKRDKTKPFFFAVQHKAPHREWIPPLQAPRAFRSTSNPTTN
ncbi:hypothetical protein [Armatimonas sp.]|uniref:hypothetical protein n=1 Tax=Armatimonas sp. TaxID=1872638 RepID=UPI00286BAF1C|nr:hypothetical protein [Armatimonas sp.]